MSALLIKHSTCQVQYLYFVSLISILLFEFTASRTMIKVVFLLWYPLLLCLVNSWNAVEIFCHAKCSRINMIHFLCSGFPILCCQSTESGFKTFLVDIISHVISKLVCVWLYLGAWETATDVFFLNPLAYTIHIVYEFRGTKAPIWSTSVPFTWNAGHWRWGPARTGRALPQAGVWVMYARGCCLYGCNGVMPSGWGTDVCCDCVPVPENFSFLER